MKKSPTIKLAPETTFRLSPDTFLEPDFVFYAAETGLPNLKGGNALLAVEVSDSSLGYDLGRKAKLYAGFGIRELWVINAVKFETHVHTDPGADGYATRRLVPGKKIATPGFAPELAVKLSDLLLV